MLKVGKTLTNARPERNVAPEFIINTTKGGCTLTAAAAAAMGLTVGDYLAVFENEGQVYLCQGFNDDNTKFGSKLGGEVGKSLSMSSTNVWQQLGGNTEEHRHYSIGGVTPGDDSEAEPVDIGNGQEATAYPINFLKTSEKIVRGGAAGAVDVDEEA